MARYNQTEGEINKLEENKENHTKSKWKEELVIWENQQDRQIFIQIDHIICHKASLSRYKKIERTPFILSDQHGLILDPNPTQHRVNMQMNKTRNQKGTRTRDTERIQRIIRSYFKDMYSIKPENLKQMDDFFVDPT